MLLGFVNFEFENCNQNFVNFVFQKRLRIIVKTYSKTVHPFYLILMCGWQIGPQSGS